MEGWDPFETEAKNSNHVMMLVPRETGECKTGYCYIDWDKKSISAFMYKYNLSRISGSIFFRAHVLDNRLYISGGRDLGEGRPSSAFLRFDPTSNRWKVLRPMKVGRCYHGMTSLGGQIIVTGGVRGGGEVLDRCEVYDPRLETWSAITPLPEPRYHHSAAADDSYVFVGGGLNNQAVPQNNFWYLQKYFKDPRKPTDFYFRWTEVTIRQFPVKLPARLQQHEMICDRGRCYVIGGLEKTGILELTTSNKVWYFKTRHIWTEPPLHKASWRELPSLPRPLSGLNAAIIANKLFVFGGHGSERDTSMSKGKSGTKRQNPDENEQEAEGANKRSFFFHLKRNRWSDGPEISTEGTVDACILSVPHRNKEFKPLSCVATVLQVLALALFSIGKERQKGVTPPVMWMFSLSTSSTSSSRAGLPNDKM